MDLSDSEEPSLAVNQESLPDSPRLTASETAVTPVPQALAPASNHQPHIIDQDVEDFTVKLDGLVAQFRNESVREFLTMKRSILHEQITTIENERKRCNAQLGIKQDELEHLREQLAQTTSTMNAYDSQRQALAGMTGRGKERISGLQGKAMSFGGWVKFHFICREKQRLGHIATKAGHQSISRRIFRSWKGHWSSYHQEKLKEKFDLAIQEERKILSIQYGKEIQLLQDRLETANRDLNQEAKSKVIIQENLKKAFMRGVCALNFEAMHILQPGQSADDPVPQTDYISGLDAIVGTAFQEASAVSAEQKGEEIEESSEAGFDEAQNVPPAESKEDKWKPAPVFGSRPQTAPPVKEAYPLHPSESEPESIVESDATLASLPSNLNRTPGQGKTIVIGRNLESEVKIKAKSSVKTKKAGAKK